MGNIYSSAMGTTVIRHRRVPAGGRMYEERGWTMFESALSIEVVARAAYFKGLRKALAYLPPKLVEIDGEEPLAAEEVDDLPFEGLVGPRIERTRASIQAASFTGKGDKDLLPRLYCEHMADIGDALEHAGEGPAGEYEGKRNAAGQREGRGVFYLARDGRDDVYEGEWRAGEKAGRGTYTFHNGDVYQGEYKADRREGHGIYTFANGDVYNGEWQADQKVGQGTFWYNNGDVYEAEHETGEKNNDDVYLGDYEADKGVGDVYRGEYKAGKKDGIGAFWYKNGDVYEGGWEADKKEGRGTFTFASGCLYEGEWKADKQEGRGLFRYANGDVYEGEWKADERDGRGTYWYADGDVDAASYRQGFDMGDGVRWRADGQAWTMHDGWLIDPILPDEAQKKATKSHGGIPGTPPPPPATPRPRPSR